MANERDNLNHLRSSVPYKKQTPIIDSGFSSKDFTESSFKKTSICVFFSSFTISFNITTLTDQFNSTIN
jgi:hypothetical protein